MALASEFKDATRFAPSVIKHASNPLLGANVVLPRRIATERNPTQIELPPSVIQTATHSGGLWEPWGSRGVVWGDLGRFLGGFGETLRKLWEALGVFGRLWEALGRLWEALGIPAARRRTKKQLYTKMLGVRKLPINQLCWPNVNIVVE